MVIIYGVAVLLGGRWLQSQMEFVDFAENHIPVGKFQWFLYIVSYLQFVIAETVSTAEWQQDEVHATKVRKTREKLIVMSTLKTDVPPIFGGLGEGKESTTPLTAICTPEMWNAHDGVRGIYPRASKSLQYQRLKLNESININRGLGRHMEVRLMASELMGICDVLWLQLAEEI